MAQRPSLRNTALRFQDGGVVPGSGRGDKIPAKYEPGEFVVSNDMIDDNPGLREQLSSLRAETLAARGKTVEEADAKALRGGPRPSLRAADGFTDEFYRGQAAPVDRAAAQASTYAARSAAVPPSATMTQGVDGVAPPGQKYPGRDLVVAGNRAVVPLQTAPVSPTTALTRTSDIGSNGYKPNFTMGGTGAPAPQPFTETPRNPGMANPQAQAAYDDMARARVQPAAPTVEPAAPAAPTSARERPRSLGVGSARAVGSTILYGGAAAGGAAIASGLRDVGAPGAVNGVVPGERQAGDSASSTQIPTGGPPGAPATPGAQPYNFWTDSEVGRNIGNMANAIAPLGGVAMAARVPGAASRVAGLADAAVTGLASGVRDERQTARAAPPNPSLRVRPEGAFAGPPALAAGAAPTDASAGVRRIDRPGQSPLFTNMPDGGLLGNDKLMGRGAISPQNMAAADNLAASNDITPRLRAQAQYDAEVANAQRINDMQQRMNGAGSKAAMLDLRSPEYLAARNASVTSTISRDGRPRLRAEVEAETARTRMAQDAQTAQMQNQTTLRGQDINAEASRYGFDNSLRGTMYSSDATLGAKRVEMQQRLQQQQLRAAIFREAGGKPEVAAKIAASYGMDSKDFTDMAAADQTRAQGAATSARKRLEGMAVRDDGKGGTVVDPGRVANLERTLTKMAPGWQHMSEPEQAELYGKAEASVNLLEGLNDRRNNSFWQSVGVDGKSASLDNLPDMKGGRLTTVKLLEGATTGGGVSRGDYALEVGGHKLYLPRDKVNQGELELLKARGVDISGMQK